MGYQWFHIHHCDISHLLMNQSGEGPINKWVCSHNSSSTRKHFYHLLRNRQDRIRSRRCPAEYMIEGGICPNIKSRPSMLTLSQVSHMKRSFQKSVQMGTHRIIGSILRCRKLRRSPNVLQGKNLVSA